MPSHDIAASEELTIWVGLIIKLVFRSRLVCIMHDAGFYERGVRESSFSMRVYYMTFAYRIRSADRIMAVPRATKKALSRFCPDPGSLVLLWEDSE
jgi:hypothetical protein